MKGHIIFSGAALILLVLYVSFSSNRRWLYSGKHRSFLHAAHDEGMKREIAERHRDMLVFYRALLGASLIKRISLEKEHDLTMGNTDMNLYLSPDWGETRKTLGCEDLAYLTGIHYLGSGFTKLVVKGTLLNGKEIALKSIHGEGNDMKSCVERYGDHVGCYKLATYKLHKEVILLQTLRHPGIIQLQGQCYDNTIAPDVRVTAMLELGSPLEMIQLLQTPWEERFKICLELVNLLHYLAHSPLGSVALLDFQPRQFVLVDESLKLTDLDDATMQELACTEDRDCVLDFPSRTFSVKCSAAGTCTGANEKRNLFNAYRFFFTYLLPHSAPPALQPLLLDIMNMTGDLHFGINETYEAFQNILNLYKSGMHHRRRPQYLKDYIRLEGFRMNETGDEYKCWPSYNHQGCLLSVHNTEEAAEFCSRDKQCQNFVIGQQRTWTGRALAAFTGGSPKLIPDVNSQVYMKKSSNFQK
ncbi:extracellular tyrosine-protein kinase PKDCC-like [Rhinophrynus dorsalis]